MEVPLQMQDWKDPLTSADPQRSAELAVSSSADLSGPAGVCWSRLDSSGTKDIVNMPASRAQNLHPCGTLPIVS